MSVPVLVLMAFAGWTLFTLLIGVAFYRWKMILTKQAGAGSFPADRVEGSDFYRRAMRAHLNCTENLPIYGAIVLTMVATGVQNPLLDKLAIVFILARLLQTSIHLFFVQRHRVAALRFLLFLIQFICMVWMGILVVLKA